MPKVALPAPHMPGLYERNRAFYDQLWAAARLVRPERLNTWPLVQSLLERTARRLEVAPGLRPRLPLAGTTFLDVSRPALLTLARCGARVVEGEIARLPFPDGSFDLVCALDVLEHIENDRGGLAELCRVTAAGGLMLLSMPLHAARWTAFDDWVGHRRRYEPAQLAALLEQHELSVQQSAAYGMQPRSSRLLDYGIWWLTNHPRRAMWWYNRIFMPLGVLFQERLAFARGLIDTDAVDEVILLCARRAGD